VSGGASALFPGRRSAFGRLGRLCPLLPQFPNSLTMACTLRARLSGATTAAAVALSLLVALTAAPTAVAGAPDELVYPADPLDRPCPPYTLCSGHDDCPPWLGTPRRCVGIGGCTSSACGINKKTCQTSICTADCRFDVGTCEFWLAGRPSHPPPPTKGPMPPVRPWPTHSLCGPYKVCGGGVKCGPGRLCVKSRCTSSWCALDPRTCVKTSCTKDCIPNRGYCVTLRYLE